ncbi:tyrosine-type recombinase/integrase [Vagococcus hydrophili]|uniref:Tyrosine-type recombinase/integrase n=1 Tax=Vagococcus hydrophili TaxID=2714947 RepID=A0A6G8AWV7_9ENTE|nr:site-specific integrase [Vagococcus hydrophili]QIL49476.1 tyrosine-type recombinase/integrase [Vagococcus hydrophili]
MGNVDLFSKSISILQKIYDLNKELDNEFIFCTNNGTPIQISAINSFLRSYVEPKMTSDKKLSSHIFRHTHVSKLAELGVPLYAIQDRVGHESSDITEKIYLHITKDVRDKLKVDIEKM